MDQEFKNRHEVTQALNSDCFERSDADKKLIKVRYEVIQALYWTYFVFIRVT